MIEEGDVLVNTIRPNIRRTSLSKNTQSFCTKANLYANYFAFRQKSCIICAC
jgi:hypothetical protein